MQRTTAIFDRNFLKNMTGNFLYIRNLLCVNEKLRVTVMHTVLAVRTKLLPYVILKKEKHAQESFSKQNYSQTSLKWMDDNKTDEGLVEHCVEQKTTSFTETNWHVYT